MLTPSLPTEASTGLPLSARRRIQAGMLATSAAGAPRTGIISASAAALVTGTTDSAMTYRIAPFVGASSRDGVGVEFVANDASETVATTISPSSNSRIDVIWYRCRFPSLTDTGQTTVIFGVTQGIANANPVKPAIPAGALELATAVVTSSDLTTQTVVITQTARFTAFAGGVVPLRNKAEQDAWTPSDGAIGYRIDKGSRVLRVNAAWAREGAAIAYPWGPAQEAPANTTITVTNYGSPTGDTDLFTMAGGVLTVSQAGWWMVNVSGASDGGTSDKYLFLTRNGTIQHVLHRASTSARFRFSESVPVKLNAGDTLRVRFLRGDPDYVGPNPDDATTPALTVVYMHP